MKWNEFKKLNATQRTHRLEHDFSFDGGDLRKKAIMHLSTCTNEFDYDYYIEELKTLEDYYTCVDEYDTEVEDGLHRQRAEC